MDIRGGCDISPILSAQLELVAKNTAQAIANGPLSMLTESSQINRDVEGCGDLLGRKHCSHTPNDAIEESVYKRRKTMVEN